jgi:hypothetical protein
MAEVDTNAIRAALAKLDVKNDDHWTEQGAPRLDALELASKVSRQDVTAAAPLFNRTNPVFTSAGQAAIDAMAAQAEAIAPPVLTSDELEMLELEVAEAVKEVEAQDKVVDAAKSKLVLAQQKRDQLIQRMDEGGADRTRNRNQEGIMAVLERGKIEREEKAKLARELRSAGITAKLLQAGSPLDQAMARKRGFGNQRPNLSARG